MARKFYVSVGNNEAVQTEMVMIYINGIEYYITPSKYGLNIRSSNVKITCENNISFENIIVE